MRIIGYRNKSDIDIEFLDENRYIKRHVQYTNFSKGEVKNPYDRTLVGVGYMGDGEYSSRAKGGKTNSSQEYIVWINMMTRCYDPKYKSKYPAYYGLITVCSEWHNFQNFAQWYNRNKYEVDGRLHVDKDIIDPSNTVYQPDKCLLVPQRINELFHYKPNKDGLPSGISITRKGRYSATWVGKSLGTYVTLEEAYEVYSENKERTIKQVADEYVDVIPRNVYNAMYSYVVDMKNDKNYKCA